MFTNADIPSYTKIHYRRIQRMVSFTISLIEEKEFTSTMNYLEGKIDFHGQILCSKYMNYATIISGVAAYIAGWLAEDSFLSIKVFIVLSIITGIICIPAWPMYKRKPLQFQKTKN